MPSIARFYDVNELRVGDKVRLLGLKECDIFTNSDYRAHVDTTHMMLRADAPGDYYVVSIEHGISDALTGVRLCVGKPSSNKKWSFTLRPDFLAPIEGESYEGLHAHEVADVLWDVLQDLNAALDSDDVRHEVSIIVERIEKHFGV